MTKAEKAQRLVDEGKVKLTRRIHSFDDPRVDCGQYTYHVTLYSNAPYVCTCGWGIFRTPADDLCAHALAVKLAVERRNEQCIPSEPT